MSIKIIIANNSDILYNSLSNIALQIEEKIEVVYIPKNKLEALICDIKKKENLIVLDSINSVTFHKNVLKNVMKHVSKMNIIILVVNSKDISNIIKNKKISFFKKKKSIFSLLNIVNLVSESLIETLDIESNIEKILWEIGLSSYFKGTTYLKDAISFAYIDNSLLFNIQDLMKKVAQKNYVLDYTLVRSLIDKSLNNALNLLDINTLYNIFGDDYDGRKISLKYFIELCIRYIDKKNNYYFKYKKRNTL